MPASNALECPYDRAQSRATVIIVRNELRQLGGERLRRVHCDFAHGVLILWGMVSEASSRDLAEDIAWSCAGVATVQSRILVDGPAAAA